MASTGGGSAIPVLHNLYIVSRNGGLVFQRRLSDAAPKLTSNDFLTIGATFHSLHAITAQIAPAEAAGVSKLEASTFVLECLETPTGVKFFVTASKGTSDLSQLLQATYKLYADYVTKNPFQASDNVIKCALFDAHLDTYLSKHWGSGVGGYRPAPAAASRR